VIGGKMHRRKRFTFNPRMQNFTAMQHNLEILVGEKERLGGNLGGQL
jgi:hypothetical protein